jgi:hypothetical protein
MRHEGLVTSLSWIPSEAVAGGTRVAFDAGFTHYDEPPPGDLGDIERLRATDRFRFANVLRAWIDVGDSGQITGSGYSGGGLMGSTMVKPGASSQDPANRHRRRATSTQSRQNSLPSMSCITRHDS